MFELLDENQHSRFYKLTLDKKTWLFIQPKQPSVLVIPYTLDNKILLVKHYRPITQKHFWEFPGGAVEPDELPDFTARRELLEETGYKAGNLELLANGYDRAGILDNELYLYKAKNCEAVSLGVDVDIADVQEFTKEQIRVLENKMFLVDLYTRD